MSKQSDAKAAQGYDPKPVLPVCGSCKHRVAVMGLDAYLKRANQRAISAGLKPGYNKRHETEQSTRCGLGEFTVNKSATCDRFERKQQRQK